MLPGLRTSRIPTSRARNSSATRIVSMKAPGMRRVAAPDKAFWIGACIGAVVSIATLNWIRIRPLFPLPPSGLFERIAFGLCPFLWLALRAWHRGLIEFCLMIVLLNALSYGVLFSVFALLVSF